MLPLVVNFYGGPGSGKSTMAARVFSELKELGHNCELVTEFAKDLTWQESMKVLDNQMYVFAKQHHRFWRLKDKVDIIVTDSPFILSIVYGSTSELFKKLVVEEFRNFSSVNIFLRRTKEYNPKGRSQTLEQAKELDTVIYEALRSHMVFDEIMPGNKLSVPAILKIITERCKLNSIPSK